MAAQPKTAPHGGAIHQTLDEPAILADIRYFRERVRLLDAVPDGEDAAMRRVYQSLLEHRRRVLAAFRAGHPERWYEYDPED